MSFSVAGADAGVAVLDIPAAASCAPAEAPALAVEIDGADAGVAGAGAGAAAGAGAGAAAAAVSPVAALVALFDKSLLTLEIGGAAGPIFAAGVGGLGRVTSLRDSPWKNLLNFASSFANN